MVAIAVVDRRSFVIPDALTAAGLGLAVVHAAAQEPDAMVHAVLLAGVRGAALAVLFLIFRSVYARIRGRQGLGLGDVKLAAVAGAWLDWSLMPIAVELAAVAALCAYVLRQAVLGRPISVTNRVPFGLFFAPAIWACWVLETTWLAPF
jgi:leader peptidase (prepilin peptidase)/N-methyltransferase